MKKRLIAFALMFVMILGINAVAYADYEYSYDLIRISSFGDDCDPGDIYPY